MPTSATLSYATAVFRPRKDKRGRLVCDCGGYSFPHRKFSGACYLGPRADYYSALRAGVSEADAAADLIWQDKLAAMPVTSAQLRKQK